MHHHFKNLTNSPYDIRLKGGKKERLPARGEIGPVEVDPHHLPLYLALGYFKVVEFDKKPTKKQLEAAIGSTQTPAPAPKSEPEPEPAQTSEKSTPTDGDGQPPVSSGDETPDWLKG